jgi:BirA family transcriptional regulator, biotin operon repressor / biotin---[acetyl-CoA-carboxylase] ligase
MVIGSKLLYFDELPSTNSEASRLLREQELPEGCVIQAGFQSAGRGHGSNKWVSDKGMNLLFSIILSPENIDPSEQFNISIAVSLGLLDYLSRHCSEVKVKWPNDIYVNDDKIAGILIENSILGGTIRNSIAGIGININQVDFNNSAPNPVSLRMKTGREYDLELCLKVILSALDNRYRELLYGDISRMREEYISSLYRLNEWHSYRSGDKLIRARLSGITSEGRLVLEGKSGLMSEYGFKEVEFITGP